MIEVCRTCAWVIGVYMYVTWLFPTWNDVNKCAHYISHFCPAPFPPALPLLQHTLHIPPFHEPPPSTHAHTHTHTRTHTCTHTHTYIQIQADPKSTRSVGNSSREGWSRRGGGSSWVPDGVVRDKYTTLDFAFKSYKELSADTLSVFQRYVTWLLLYVVYAWCTYIYTHTIYRIYKVLSENMLSVFQFICDMSPAICDLYMIYTYIHAHYIYKKIQGAERKCVVGLWVHM